jgi:hypothetical protein
MSKADFPQFVWIWNRMQSLATPVLHIEMARWLERRWQRGDRRLLLMAFRSSGKSTLVGLFAAWLLYQNPDLRILVLSGEFALARKMARNTRRIIERHPLTQGLKPSRAEQWASDQFTVRRSAEWRDPSMLAKGIGANITGARADVIICDDVEVPNTCDTLNKRLVLRQYLREASYVLVPGGTQLYIGTPHTQSSIYAREPQKDLGEEHPLLEDFVRLEIPLIDDDGASRWPERFSADAIESLRRATGDAKFESQMLLRPRALDEGRLDLDRLRRYEGELSYRESNHEAVLMLNGHRLVSASCWWDPSYGSPSRGDASVVAALFTDQDGNQWLHRIQYLCHDPAADVDEATQLCRQVVAFARRLYLPSIAVETNGIGRFLPGLLRREIAAAGLRCLVIEHAARRNKDLRIMDAFDAVLAAGRLWAHACIWSTPFIEEMRAWRPGVPGRDDGLDAVAGCLLKAPSRLPRRFDGMADRPGQEHPGRNHPPMPIASSAFDV